MAKATSFAPAGFAVTWLMHQGTSNNSGRSIGMFCLQLAYAAYAMAQVWLGLAGTWSESRASGCVVGAWAAMEQTDLNPQLLEVLRSHQEEITLLLDTWMSRLSAQLAGCWAPEATSSLSPGRSGSPRREPREPRELEPLPVDPLDASAESAGSAGSDFEPPMDISAEVRQEATESNEKVDSSYTLARQTDRRILKAFNKLTSFTIYGPNHAKKSRRLSGWAAVRAQVQALMSSHVSHMFWALVIMTNSVYLGVHLDWSVDHRGSSGNPTFFALHLIYALLFTLEVVLRVMAWGCRTLLWGQDWALQKLALILASPASCSRVSLCQRLGKGKHVLSLRHRSETSFNDF